MAAIANKVVIVSQTATFNSGTVKFKSAPCGVPETTDLPDVTCNDDVEQRFDQSALTEDGDIVLICSSVPAALNTSSTLTLVQKVRVGSGQVQSKSSPFGTCILTKINPVTIEAEGDRVNWFECTFKPDGTRT